MRRALLALALAFLSTPILRAEEPTPPEPGEEFNRAEYHLFRPTPSGYLRGMSTDRPDKTEGPFTVDPGHVQVETDLFIYTRDRIAADVRRVKVESYAIGATNVRVGLFANLDCHFLWSPYVFLETVDLVTRERQRREGVGDLTFRMKFNLFGNEDGVFAMALLPYVTFPTARYGLGPRSFTGGLIVPLNINLPFDFSIGTQLSAGVARDLRGNGTHAEFTIPVSFGYGILENLDVYVEVFTLLQTERGRYNQVTLDTGITWKVTPNVQLDAGVNVGLTRSADDIQPFVGITVRY